MAIPRHIRDGQRNRERILDAASKLMSERGVAGTTIAAICEEAEVMPPTLYWHFGDKGGLVAAVMERAAERWFAEFVPAEGVDPSGPPQETMESLFRERPEFLRLLLLLALERSDPDSEARAAVERVRERAKQSWSAGLEQIFAAIENPRQRKKAADRLSEFFLVQLDGAFIACQLHPDSVDLESLRELSRVAIRAVSAELIRESRDKRSAPRARPDRARRRSPRSSGRRGTRE
jgi:AcrR family transcriptional regulator